MSDVGDDVVAVPEVRGEHAVVSGEVGAWAWDQRGKPGNEVEGVKDDVSGPVTEGVLESVDDLSPFIDREAFVGECRAGDVAAQACTRESRWWGWHTVPAWREHPES